MPTRPAMPRLPDSRRRLGPRAVGLVATCLLGLPGAPATRADSPVTLVDGRYGRLVTETSHQVRAKVHGLVAETEVTLALRSTSAGDEEAIVMFHTPHGAVVTDLWLKVGARWTRGALLAANAVRRAIQDTSGLPSRADPAWLEQTGPDSYRLRVFPVPPRGAAEVRYRYLHPVTLRWGQRLYVYPRREDSPRLAPALVTLEDHSPFRVGVTKHQIRVAPKATLERPLADPAIPPGTPLRAVLYTAPGAGDAGARRREGAGPGRRAAEARDEAAARPGTSVGYALLLLQGNPEASRRRWGTDVVFVVDRSRSMWRAHRKSAEAVVQSVLRELGANTRFGLVAFHREAQALTSGLRPASEAERRRALAALARRKAANGTSLAAGLAKAYGLLGKGSTARRRLVVVLTDGLLAERERQHALWPEPPPSTELLILVGRPHRGLSYRLTEGPLAALAGRQGGLAYTFDPLRLADAVSDGKSHEETGTLGASLARPGRLTDLDVRVDGSPIPLPHKDLTLLGGHLAFHKTLGVPREARIAYGFWGQRRRETLTAKRLPAAWARPLQALFDPAAQGRAGVSPDLSLVVVHPEDAFGRDRLAFARRWGDRFFRRMAPLGELRLSVGPFDQGAGQRASATGDARPVEEGQLTKKIVRRLLTTSYVKQATRCYQDTGPRFKEGQAVLTLDLTQGEVADAWIEHSTMGDASLHRCLVKAALDLVVARSHADETLYRVTYPMRFHAADRSVDEVRGWRPPRPRTLPNPLKGLRD